MLCELSQPEVILVPGQYLSHRFFFGMKDKHPAYGNDVNAAHIHTDAAKNRGK